jgi:hypothetical protein
MRAAKEFELTDGVRSADISRRNVRDEPEQNRMQVVRKYRVQKEWKMSDGKLDYLI